MHLLISLLLVSYAFGVVIHENVIFHKVNEITTTRARWLVTFVQDLSPFRLFLARVSADIDGVANVTDAIIRHYRGPKQDSFLNTLINLREEVDSLYKTMDGILLSYNYYRSLGSRSRRSVIPVVGRIMSFLFGTISESDLDDVRRGINDLSQNQQEIIHVLEEQMTILNVSRVQIAENRNAIIDLVKCVNLFDMRIRKLATEIQKQLEHVEMFVNLYSQLDLILSDIKDALQRAMFYLENLRLELNMLSLDHLSPSTITPGSLKSLLIQIKTKLPSTLKLPEDPEADIWYFYRTLTCTTVLENDKILILINIPLLDYNGEFDVYKVYSIPVPLHQNFSRNSGLPDMVAKYSVEYSGLLMNKDRSQYAPLTEHELQTCGSAVVKYCSPQNAVLPVNLHRLCILALFFKDDKKIDENCHKIVEPNAILPSATYISSGQWLVSAKEPLEFSVVCLASTGHKSPMTQTTQKMATYVDVISLKSGCHAANDYLNLPPYYEFQEQMTMHDPLSNLLEIRGKVKFRIWNPLIQNISNFTKIKLPENLKAIAQIPMNEFVTRLRRLKRVEVKDTSWPVWVYILINLGITFVLVVILYYFCKVRRNKQKWVPNSACLRSCTSICEVREGTNKGKPNQRRQSARVDDRLVMSTLLKDGENLTCGQSDTEEIQSSLLSQLGTSPPKTTK